MPRIAYDAKQPSTLVDAGLAGSRLMPFWIEDAAGARPTFASAPATPTSFDLVVVGGGYTGLWSALLAKQRDPGLRVALVEAQTVGWAASGRNGGFVEASLTHGEENGRSRWPEEYERIEALGLRNFDEIEQTVADLGIDCDLVRDGALTVATEPYQAAEILAERSGSRQARPPGTDDVVVLDQAETRALVNSPLYLASVWDKRGTAVVHPAKLAYGLAEACAQAGVEIFEHTRVLELSRTGAGGRVRLLTPVSTITAGRVVLATNAFPSLLARYRLHTVPVYDYALMTEPLSGEQLRELGWAGGQGVADSSSQFHYYRKTADDRILWGGYDVVWHPGGRIKASYEERPETYRKLASHFYTTFPFLEDVAFTHRWAGVIDTCSRFCAFFGQGYGKRVVYAAGFTGLGVGASRFAAQVLLDTLDGVENERTSLRMVRETPLPFPPEPARTVGIELVTWATDRADHNDGRRNVFLRALDRMGLGFDS